MSPRAIEVKIEGDLTPFLLAAARAELTMTYFRLRLRRAAWALEDAGFDLRADPPTFKGVPLWTEGDR